MSAVPTSTLLVQRTAKKSRHIRSSNSHLFLSHSGNGYRIDVFFCCGINSVQLTPDYVKLACVLLTFWRRLNNLSFLFDAVNWSAR